MPSVTIWDRIEPRCRANDLTQGLEARVHDPLWLLARQWQVGEFEGRDAGSPVVATVASSAAPLDRYSGAGQAVQKYDGVHPIEALVEREAARPSSGGNDLRQAAEAGLYFLRLLAAASAPPTIAAAYLAQYALSAPASAASDVTLLAPVIAGRLMDGVKLHADLVAAGATLPVLPAIPANQQAMVLAVTRAWLGWYASLFTEPTALEGWSADRMEYQFAMAAAGGSGSYAAQEYDGGSIDWHTFDHTSASLAAGTAQPVAKQQKVIVTPVTFRGMPARRFWEFEDGGTNLGLLSASAEDLGRLLLREFALIYGNDWFQFPINAPVNSQFLVTSLSVADTFGIAIAIPHYSAFDGAQAGWHMFTVSSLDPPSLTNSPVPPQPILLTAGAVAPVNGSAMEDVLMIRDEAANLAWGIERTVAGASGLPLDRTLEWRVKAPAAAPASNDPVPHYRLGSTVPDYWLPFLPVRLDAAGHLLLRRGRLPDGGQGPQGRMLGEETTIFVEEIPREGVHLVRRCRWALRPDGSGCLWIGRLRTVAPPEGRSGVKYDYLE